MCQRVFLSFLFEWGEGGGVEVRWSQACDTCMDTSVPKWEGIFQLYTSLLLTNGNANVLKIV